MKSSEMINKIKTLLDIQIKLEERKLENGTVVEAESFEKGKDIFIKTDDEKVAMPVGEYILESGELIVVEDEGVIADVREVSDEVPEKEETTEDMAEGDDEAVVEDWAGMEKRIKNLEDAVADLKKDKEPVAEEAVEAEAEDSNVNLRPKSRTIKEEFSNKELEEKIKEDLSQPAVEPIKHSPEAKVEVEKILFSQKRGESTMDRVLDKIINN
tara:strand:+ start:1218 stop:1856 length:639 start_codon:yes stop_codon:yes gene_type:complete